MDQDRPAGPGAFCDAPGSIANRLRVANGDDFAIDTGLYKVAGTGVEGNDHWQATSHGFQGCLREILFTRRDHHHIRSRVRGGQGKIVVQSAQMVNRCSYFSCKQGRWLKSERKS